MVHNLVALVITFAVALLWLRLNDFTAQRGWISSDLSRKIIHMGTGPIFVLCWLIFLNTTWARYLASLVPLAITAQFFLVGSGVIGDEAAVKAMSRNGDRREILKGPLYYGIIFVVITALFWYDTPVGIIALMLMCGGDGLADILGRRFGKRKIPWNPQKSWIGSLGMLLGGLVFAILTLSIYFAAGIFYGSFLALLPAVVVIAFMATLVETLPFKDIDNITITLTAIVFGFLLL
jgi:phytol kinase